MPFGQRHSALCDIDDYGISWYHDVMFTCPESMLYLKYNVFSGQVNPGKY